MQSPRSFPDSATRLDRDLADSAWSTVTAGSTLAVSEGPALLVMKAADTPGALRCGAAELKPHRPPSCWTPAVPDGSIRPGDRYLEPVSGLEVLCTRGGNGILTFAGRPMRRL